MDQELAPEVRIDLSSEYMATDQACQDSCKITQDCNEESNPMARQPSEIQGDSNPAEPPPDCNEERIPKALEESETQGNSDPAEPPPEVHSDVDPEGTASDKASQGGPGHRRKKNKIKIKRGGLGPLKVKPKPAVNEKYRSLFEATVKGDWKGAEEILNHDPPAITAILLTTEIGPATVSDIAVMAGQDQLVENLVKRVPAEDKAPILKAALCHAARMGRIRRVKELVDDLDKVVESGVGVALSIATRSAPKQKEVIWNLARDMKSTPKYDLVLALIKAGHLDILLHLANAYPDLTNFDKSKNLGLLKDLAHVKSYYRSGAQLNFWEKCIYQCIPSSVDPSTNNVKDAKMARGKIAHLVLRVAPFIKRIGELKLRHECWLELAILVFKGMKDPKRTPERLQLTSAIVLEAASNGISEIVKLCLEQYPELMWDIEFTKELIEEVVRGRHVELFRLMNACDTIPNLTYDIQRNRDLMEAVVGWSTGYAPADVSGAAFLMQRELQWFEVLENRSSPKIESLKFKMKVMKGESDPSSTSLKLELVEKKRGKTYREIFVEQRKDLLQEARQWMKDTSSSCTLVATLIITVVFAAAFTVPGGNDNTGIPIFLKKTSFTVFAIADALALFSSITATLMFLAILTSRYAAKDFLHSLPRKMILGLTFLFLSLAFMLVAFGSALTIILSGRWKWIYIPITLWAAVPVILFAILQLPLYVEMVESTFCPRLYRPMKIWK